MAIIFHNDAPYIPQPKIVVAHDHVEIEGKRIERPARLSPSQWLDFWNDAIDQE